MEEAERLVQQALEAGFYKAAPVSTAPLAFLPAVRAMCADNRCGQYGANWACPPACGTVEECEARVRKYQMGIVMESVGLLEDSFDVEGMEAAAAVHKRRFETLVQTWRRQYPGLLALGAGGCGRCEACAYPDAPCRFPDAPHGSMEGYGLMVSDVCNLCGLPYNNGKDTVTYIACVFYK